MLINSTTSVESGPSAALSGVSEAGGEGPEAQPGPRPLLEPDWDWVWEGTPLTNRGSPSATNLDSDSKTGVSFHLDYLKGTIFTNPERGAELVMSYLLERGATADPAWEDLGPGDVWQNIRKGPGPVYLLEPKPSIAKGSSYVCFEVKGEGCEFYGSNLLQGFIASLNRSGERWHMVRLDPCWDGVGFGPDLLHETVKAGNLNSRTFDSRSRDLWQNALGKTCYVGKGKERMVRLYDRRGFNRLEFQVRKQWATALAGELAEAEVSRWSSISLGYLRRTVDFVDRSKSAQACRCPLLPWWSSFVGEVEKSGVAIGSHREPPKALPIGIADDYVLRHARKLQAIVKALGEDWLVQRVRHYGEPRLTQADLEFSRALEAFKYSGLAGTPTEAPDAEEVPF